MIYITKPQTHTTLPTLIPMETLFLIVQFRYEDVTKNCLWVMTVCYALFLSGKNCWKRQAPELQGREKQKRGVEVRHASIIEWKGERKKADRKKKGEKKASFFISYT